MTVSKLFIDSDRGVDTAEGWRQIIHRIYKLHRSPDMMSVSYFYSSPAITRILKRLENNAHFQVLRDLRFRQDTVPVSKGTAVGRYSSKTAK